MRRFIPAALLLLSANFAHAQTMALNVNQARPINLKSIASGVVVGNAGVVDVIVHDAKTLIFVGKSVGTTSILVLGAKGQTIYSGEIKVNAPEIDGVLTVQKGTQIQTSICQDRCISVPSLESDPESMNNASNGIRTYSTYASGTGSGSVTFGTSDAAPPAAPPIPNMPPMPR